MGVGAGLVFQDERIWEILVECIVPLVDVLGTSLLSGWEGGGHCDFFFKLLKTRLPLSLVYFFMTPSGVGSLLCWAGLGDALHGSSCSYDG